MRIKSVYISAFGALKDKKIEFSDGLQVIYGENEAGKTTVTEFIKSMFYGTGRRAAGQLMSIREKYTPLDGAQAGGRVYFEHAGKEYCIERQFRKSDATDKIVLTDIGTGKSEPCASDIGNSLFGITMPAFERSVFIGNTPDIRQDDGAFGEINQKLSNAALTGEDSVSYQKVLNRLDDARLKLKSKSGKTGTLVSDVNEYNALIEALGEADSAARKKQEMKSAVDRTVARIKKITAEYEETQALLDGADDARNLQKLKEYIEEKEHLDEVTKKLTLADGKIADEMFLKKFEFGFSKVDGMRARISAAKDELESLESAANAREGNSPEQIKKKIEEAKEELAACGRQKDAAAKEAQVLREQVNELETKLQSAKNRKKPVNPVLLIAGIVCLAAGAALYIPFGNMILTAVVCAIGAIVAVCGFVFRPADTSAAKEAADMLAASQNSLTAKNSEIMMLSGQINNLEAKIENLNISLNFGVNEQRRLLEVKERLEKETEHCEEETKKVLKFFGLPEDTNADELKEKMQSLSAVASEQKQIKLHLSYLSRDLGGISYDEARERIKAAGGKADKIDLEATKEKLKLLANEKSEAENLKTKLETEIKTGFRGLSDPEDIRRDIEKLKESIAAKQAFYDAASTAYDVLSDSFIAARKSFGSVLESKTLKNFEAITENAYGAVNVSSDFDISVEKSGMFGMHGLEYLSRGTKDQVYLALRLAVSELITEKEPLPVILDDSLSQYDDGRFSAALGFLSEYAKDTQICLFTCHRYVVEEAEKQGIKTFNI